MRMSVVVMFSVLLWGCGSAFEHESWQEPGMDLPQTSLEQMGVLLLHTLPPGMEASLRVTNGATEAARAFSIDYEERPVVSATRTDRGFNPVDPAKVPLVDVPPPAYTQTLEAHLVQALHAHGYESRAIVEGACYSPALLPAYDIVVLTPAQAACISVFRHLGYYVTIYDGDPTLQALNALIEEVTP